jgi:hypothetical protein
VWEKHHYCYVDTPNCWLTTSANVMVDNILEHLAI